MFGHLAALFGGGHARIPANSALAPVSLNVNGAAANQIGDILVGAVVSVRDSAHSRVTIRDGAGGADLELVPTNAEIGPHNVDLYGIRSIASGWFCTTDTGVEVTFVGRIR